MTRSAPMTDALGRELKPGQTVVYAAYDRRLVRAVVKALEPWGGRMEGYGNVRFVSGGSTTCDRVAVIS